MFLGQSDMLDINDDENDYNHEQENESDTNIEENEVLGKPFVMLSHRQISTNTSEIQNPVFSINLASDFELSLSSGDHTWHLTNVSISFS